MDSTGKYQFKSIQFFNVFGSIPDTYFFHPIEGDGKYKNNTLDNVLVPRTKWVINIMDYAMVEQMSLAEFRIRPGKWIYKAGQNHTSNSSNRLVVESKVSFEMLK